MSLITFLPLFTALCPSVEIRLSVSQLLGQDAVLPGGGVGSAVAAADPPRGRPHQAGLGDAGQPGHTALLQTRPGVSLHCPVLLHCY